MEKPASVEACLPGLPAGSRAALEKLRGTIRTAAAEATEAIGYQMPGVQAGRSIARLPHGLQGSGHLLPDEHEDLGEAIEPYRTVNGTISLRPDERPPRS